jgi:CBS domain-containing protein
MEAREIMTKDVRTVRVDDSLDTAARIMWETDCGSLPVVDEQGVIVAMVTDRDICMHAWSQGRALGDLKVSGAMSRGVVTCAPTDSLKRVERVMQKNRIRRLPIADDAAHLVGILSLSDLFRETTAEIAERELVHTLAKVCEPNAGTPAYPSGTA